MACWMRVHTCDDPSIVMLALSLVLGGFCIRGPCAVKEWSKPVVRVSIAVEYCRVFTPPRSRSMSGLLVCHGVWSRTNEPWTLTADNGNQVILDQR
jgi:hypothetical protein